MKDTSWMKHGNCLDLPTDPFFPELGGTGVPAKSVCRGCSVKAECLEFAMTSPIEKHGIWGGLTARERSRARVEARRTA